MIKPLETNTPTMTSAPPRVLLVDDEVSILNAERRLLRNEGYVLFTATRGAEALEILETQGPFDLLVTDFRMEDMTGIQLLEAVQSRWPDTQRVMLSGYSQVDTILDAVNRGAVYKYLSKPWNDEELKLSLRRAIEQGALQKANAQLLKEVEDQNRRLVNMNAQLEQNYDDAIRGLNFNQALFQWIDAAVLTVDYEGVVVGANARMIDLMGPEVIGLQGRAVLPEPLHRALEAGRSDGSADAGRLRLAGRNMQWRARTFVHEREGRGRVVTLWEEL